MLQELEAAWAAEDGDGGAVADLDLLPQALERLRVLNANLNPTQAGFRVWY